MTFNSNHPILFLLVGLLVAVVMGQSVYFLVKALKRSKEIGMDQAKIKKTIRTAAIFTIAPAVSIHQCHHPEQESGHRSALAASERCRLPQL